MAVVALIVCLAGGVIGLVGGGVGFVRGLDLGDALVLILGLLSVVLGLAFFVAGYYVCDTYIWLTR